MQLHGLHHVTAVTGNAPGNLDFYTRVLGLRLVKRTVNQDDVSAYHLFYADKLGSPGADITFFDWPRTGPDQRGTDAIVNTQFRVNGQAALDYWAERFDQLGVWHGPSDTSWLGNGRAVMAFEDHEGQRLALVDDGGAPFEGEVWPGAPGAEVPAEFALRGFYGVGLSVPRLDRVEPILTRILGFQELDRRPHPTLPDQQMIVYGMDGGGPGREVTLVVEPDAPRAWLGRGGVHHVAFRLRDDAEQAAWAAHLNQSGLRHSGVIDRFWFKSLYFRISNGILFELATDGPGFGVDEDMAHLGETLVLPPFLEGRRGAIEAGLRPL
jgi:glyoxalase family protein